MYWYQKFSLRFRFLRSLDIWGVCHRRRSGRHAASIRDSYNPGIIAAPCRRKGRSRAARLACIPPYLLDLAQRVRDRRESAAGTTPACGHSHDDEHLHESGSGASAGGEQQGRSASAAYRDVRPFFVFPHANASISAERTYGGSVWESKGHTNQLRLGPSRRCNPTLLPIGTNGTLRTVAYFGELKVSALFQPTLLRPVFDLQMLDPFERHVA